ncbi:choice-of-anchor L domain-containing protein [Mesonia aestuariivivens]|uniref:Gliding motility-associated C-terminal domain-containing protein n=1 Tax=Mesonia aestuariivivens TaxID=2796128 RepID=A0ABS6W0M5_9FLAO|nr:choice-of-anchor L domain-containing protein [Mesonia aestuariivivens]MBW2961372.1 gliding motility-associated C-terminal domain-containing protein [Mesonia aestuariivivens]
MKNSITLFILLVSCSIVSQNITVNSNNYTPQELVEDVLINNGCIQNINVTGSVSGNFSSEKSFGYFEKNNTNFPFDSGIVMSTGRLSNVPGPNDHLSDDDASGWGSDQDLEQVLGISNTYNATVIEFDFTPNANFIQFKYIFASEEYRASDSRTCQYSDVFGFLIKPIGGTYSNIAVVPGTNTPVKVTTVHPQIVDGNNGCNAINEQYFGSFNGINHPINFNGQTKPLVAEANVIAGTTYHIKLVIADDSNYRYDSAVFLEANSFNIGLAPEGEDIIMCDDFSNDGFTDFDLTENDNIILANQSTGDVNYYLNENDADNLQNEITNPSNFTNTSNPQEIFARIVNQNSSSCYEPSSFEISVQDIEVNSIDETLVESSVIFDLTAIENSISLDSTQFIEGYYLNAQEASFQMNAINSPEAFESINDNQEIFIRINSTSSCYSIYTFKLETIEKEDSFLFIPQGFSPNNDGINDTFHIENLYETYGNFEIKIYSRNGNLVFEGNNSKPEWDGTSTHGINSGNQLPTGTYYYVLELNDAENKIYKNWVYINR